MSIVERFKRFRLRSLDKRDLTRSDKAPLENTDAMAVHSGAPAVGGGPELVPPNYVKAYDEGRPRH
jgi:hypothetical protein